MSHHIYQTKAYIIDSVEAGEANKRLVLLTEDLGVIVVSAQGVRVGHSKLKASIQDFSYSKISVVRGKEVWRLTNAERLISLYDRRLPIVVRKLLIHALQFVKRLTPTDVKMDDLFILMSKLSSYCFENKEKAAQEVELLRLLFEIRTLTYLGYGSADNIIKDIIADKKIDQEDLLYLAQHKIVLQKHVDIALLQSHL